MEFFLAAATGVSAVGTCAAAVVVAFQAVMTRKAVQAAQDSAELSRELVAEAVRARLDARAPRTSLEVLDPAMWPPYEPSIHGKAQQLPVGTRYQLPHDADRLIEIRAYLRFTNRSDQPLDVALSQAAPINWNEQGHPPRST